MTVADGRVTLSSDPGLRVEVDATVRAIESVDRRNQLSIVARLTVFADDRGGTLRLIPAKAARRQLSVVIELVGEHALLPFDEETASWSTVIAPDRRVVLLVIEHPSGTHPDVVLATLEQSRPGRPGVTRGIPPAPPPVLPQQYAPPPTVPPTELPPDLAQDMAPEMAPEWLRRWLRRWLRSREPSRRAPNRQLSRRHACSSPRSARACRPSRCSTSWSRSSYA